MRSVNDRRRGAQRASRHALRRLRQTGDDDATLRICQYAWDTCAANPPRRAPDARRQPPRDAHS
ncbi:protein of unknown function [Burkholderia multivorans]